MRRIDMATLPGCYGERYEVKDEDGSPKSYTGYTFLEIQRSSESGQLRFSAGATGGFGGNLHYCSAVGDLEVNELDSDLVVFSLNPDREEAEMEEALGLKCRMKIIVTPRSFYLHDFGYQCEQVFLCGMRAHLGNAKFPLKRVKPSICHPSK